MGWIDVHTHLNFLKDMTPEEGLAQARAAGVTRFITIGTEPADHTVVLELARKYFPEVGCTLGVHPHEGAIYSDDVEKFIDTHAPEKEVIAIGEIGLDYHYDKSPRDEQKVAFRRQLALAAKHGMTVEILKEFKGKIPGILHCFTGTQWLAEQALDLGLDISFSGVITFKNAGDLREVVKYVPLERLHVETDAPYLAPVPQRGKSNVPAFVVHTAAAVAELKGIGLEQLQAATIANARRTFPKLRF
jgi:TatD DNase family protein